MNVSCVETDSAGFMRLNEAKKTKETQYVLHSDVKQSRKLLPDGFGFTEDTFKFRLPEFQPRLISDPRKAEDKERPCKFCSKNRPAPREKAFKDTDENGKCLTNQSGSKEENGYLTIFNGTLLNERLHARKHTAGSAKDDKDQADKKPENRKDIPRDQLHAQDLELDLIVEGVVRKTIVDGTRYAPDDFVYNGPPKQTRLIAKKRIHIPHWSYGRLEEDEFGASLYTFEDTVRDGVKYYRHYLEKIKPDSPAEKMGIEEKDEIVLLLGCFVPDKKQQNVLKLFHKIKVDGKTRFVMVIRRRRVKWVWLELSAILAPEMETEQYPIVEKPESKTLSSNSHELSETPRFYKVPGSELYLQINNGIVSVDVMNGRTDETKVIWKREYVYQAGGTEDFKFEASLADETKKLYVTIDRNKNIVLDSKPQLFQLFVLGDKVRFRANDTYLGCDRAAKQVKAQVSNCEFQEFPVQSSFPLKRSRVELTNDDKVDCIDGTMPIINVELCTQKSSDSGTSSIFSSQISSDSDISSQLSCESERGVLLSQVSIDSCLSSLSPQIIPEDSMKIVSTKINDKSEDDFDGKRYFGFYDRELLQ